MRQDSPLIQAAMRNQPENIITLISAGASLIDRSVSFGNTPLLWAIGNSSVAAALTLLNYKNEEHYDLADTNNQNTPLIMSIAKGSFHQDKQGNHQGSQREIITKLIEIGADVNKADKYGNTPLHFAFLQQDMETIKLLIEHNANLKAKNNYGDTPLEYLFKSFTFKKRLLTSQVGPYHADMYHQYSNENFKDIMTKHLDQVRIDWGEVKVDETPVPSMFLQPLKDYAASGQSGKGINILLFIGRAHILDQPRALLFKLAALKATKSLDTERDWKTRTAIVVANFFITVCTGFTANIINYLVNKNVFFKLHQPESLRLLNTAMGQLEELALDPMAPQFWRQ